MARKQTPQTKGFAAGYSGEPVTKNPYLVLGGGKDAFDWQQGWWEGRDRCKRDLADKIKDSAQ